MISYNHALIAFNNYIKDYDLNDANIKLKVVHTMQVVKVMDELSRQLHLSEEDRLIARVIGLLHDFGRFEQWKRYHSFLDYKTIDHALFSCELLFDQGYIRNFIEEDTYDDLIHKAIAQHNKYKIDEGFTERELLFIHLIRDADKLDNFRVKKDEKIETLLFVSLETLESERITPVVYRTMKSHQLILSTDRVTELDFWLSYIAFIYDLHFIESYQIVADHHYIDTSFDRVYPRNKEVLNQYLELKLDMKEYVKNVLKKKNL